MGQYDDLTGRSTGGPGHHPSFVTSQQRRNRNVEPNLETADDAVEEQGDSEKGFGGFTEAED